MHKPEEITGKLGEVEIVLAQGTTMAEACLRISVSRQIIIKPRERIKRQTIEHRRMQHRKLAA